MGKNNQITSFVINKAITTSKLFAQIKLSLSAKLVLRCITDYWNYKIGCAYPTQATIADCTGLSDNSVMHAISELTEQGLLNIVKKRNRNYYCFTLKFWGYVKLIPSSFEGHTLKFCGKIPSNFADNNILKEKEKTRKKNFLNSLSLENISGGNAEDKPIKISEIMAANLSRLKDELPIDMPSEEEYISNLEEYHTENLRNGGIPPGAEANNLKDIEQKETAEDAELGMAIATIKHLGHNPVFREKAEELMKKFNLDKNGEPIS